MYVNLEINNEANGNVEKEQRHDETAEKSMREGTFFMMVSDKVSGSYHF